MNTPQGMPIGPVPTPAVRKSGRRTWSTRSARPDDRRTRETKKSEYFAFKLTPALKDVVRDLAAEEGISLTGWVTRRIVEAARVRSLAVYDRRQRVWVEKATGRALTQP